MTKLTKKISIRDKARAGKKYHSSLRGYQTRKDILKSMINALDIKCLPKTIYLADLGCGPGIVGLTFYEHLKKKFDIKIHFVDINPDMLSAIPKNKDFNVIEEDITNLKLKHDFYDIVTIKQALHYLPKDFKVKALHNIKKILKHSGQFILSALISPSDDDYYFQLNNLLYTKREKILNPSAPIKKYIPTKKILINWLQTLGFKKINIHYIYDIPFSVKDFVKSFGLNKEKKETLIKLYEEVIRKDINNRYKSRNLGKEDYELVEKGVIISCRK